jgi:hypothetical protein
MGTRSTPMAMAVAANSTTSNRRSPSSYFDLRTAVHHVPEWAGKRPLLLYLYGEPEHWPEARGSVSPEHKMQHRSEVAFFSDRVMEDEVAFRSCCYSELLAGWAAQPDQRISAHATADETLHVLALQVGSRFPETATIANAPLTEQGLSCGSRPFRSKRFGRTRATPGPTRRSKSGRSRTAF